MTILANFTSNSSTQPDRNVTNTQNQTKTNSSNNDAATDLWNWGKIPAGYELNKNGSLTELPYDLWKPSI